MSKPKHTPGPWFLDKEDKFTVRTSGENKLQWIVDLYSDADTSNVYGMLEREANARLIAAAPEMLELLEYWLQLDAHAELPDETDILRIKSIVAKAQGGA